MTVTLGMEERPLHAEEREDQRSDLLGDGCLGECLDTVLQIFLDEQVNMVHVCSSCGDMQVEQLA